MKTPQRRDVLLAQGGYYAATGMAAGYAVGLAAVDAVYVAKRRISPVYLVDALAQLVFAAGPAARRRREPGSAGGAG